MGLKDTHIVDLVTRPLPGDTCKLVLFVVDDGSVEDPVRRYKLLIAKLTAYVTYVAGDDFRTQYPGLTHADVLVRVLCVTPPNDAMTDVQGIGARNNPDARLRVVFADYNQFFQSLKPGKPPVA